MIKMVKHLSVLILISLAVYMSLNFFKCNKVEKLSPETLNSEITVAYVPNIEEDWRLILVNASNPIPENYNVDLTELKNGVCVDSRIYPDLQLMFDDARNEGIYPVVGEGYRTYEEQADMMRSKINSYINEGYSLGEAEDLAEDYVAKPGTSEHELGIALDINADKTLCSNEEVYDWLYENAYRYGFVLRYPSGKENITGIDYEPWHYRYVGHEAAEEIYNSGLTLEEYLDKF